MSKVEPGELVTLPDYLAPGLRLVFIGINPSVYSVEQGRYFARRTNRFWPAFSRSRLSAPIRAALGREELGPEDDERLREFGIGFTDVVKRPSNKASDLTRADFQREAPMLLERLRHYAPQVACFHGVTGYRAFAREVLDIDARQATPGPQPVTIGTTRVYVVPNPSPANAHVRPADQIAWYDRLADFLDELDAAPE